MTDPLDAFDTAEGALEFWLPADDTPADETYLPWGLIARGSSADTRLRVRNESDDYLAQGVIVAVDGPVDPDAADASTFHLLSLDGDTFTPTINVGTLPPNSVTAPFTLRRITPPDAPAGDAGFTLTAAATAWLPAAAVAATATTTYDPATVPASPEDTGGTTVDPTTVPVDAPGTFDPAPPPAPADPAGPDPVPVDADEDWTPPA